MNKNSVVLDETSVAVSPTDRGHDALALDAIAGDTVQLRVPGSHRYISVVRETVDAVSQQLRLSPDDRMAVKIAVGEACNNAVEHAPTTEGRTPPTMTVCVKVNGDALEIEVSNQGNGWRPQPKAKMPDPLNYAERGRGMPLMEMLMDSVEYISVGGNTTVRMRKRLSQTPPTG
jgi:serine/threonine-protein kinase RsbW